MELLTVEFSINLFEYTGDMFSFNEYVTCGNLTLFNNGIFSTNKACALSSSQIPIILIL